MSKNAIINAAKAKHMIDGTFAVQAVEARRLLAKAGCDFGLRMRLRKQWPTSQHPARQVLTLKMAGLQADRLTFSRDYYHYTYEQYLGKPADFDAVYPLLQKRQTHWTDLALARNAPTVAVIKRLLAEAGVNVEYSHEDMEAWLVCLAHFAQTQPWLHIEAELRHLMQRWTPGTMSARFSLAVCIFFGRSKPLI